MMLFEAIVQIPVGPVLHAAAELGADRLRIGIVTRLS
jgi:hypothetical protein